MRYTEAIDPLDSGRTYTETDVPIAGTAMTETEEKAAYDILTGGDSMSILQEARAMRAAMERASESLDDQTVSTDPAMLRRLKQDGKLVSAETRINWGGTVKRAAVDLWDTAENTPDSAPTLWDDIN